MTAKSAPQLSFFDRARAQAECNQALNRVECAASDDWKRIALDAIHRCALSMPTFTTDDVWRVLVETDARTHEPRALGALMRTAARKGWICDAGASQKSDQVSCHGRKKAVWRSRLCVAALRP